MFVKIYNTIMNYFRPKKDLTDSEIADIRCKRIKILPFYWKTNKIHCENNETKHIMLANTAKLTHVRKKSEGLKSAAADFAVMTKQLKDSVNKTT